MPNKSYLFKLPLLILLNYTFLTHSLLAQTDFREGFIIKQDGDTLVGELLYRKSDEKYFSSTIKQNKERQDFLPSQIKGYGFLDDKFFISGIAENEFVEVLLEGNLSLYKTYSSYKEAFYIVNEEGRISKLETKRLELIRNGERYVKDDNLWIGKLLTMTQDCNEGLPSPETLKLNQKTILDYVAGYNECQSSPYRVYKSRLPWIKLNYGILLGYLQSNFLVKDRQISETPHLLDSYNSSSFIGGLTLQISLPKFRDNTFFVVEGLYHEESYLSTVIRENAGTINYYDTSVDISTLSLSFSGKYNFRLPTLQIVVQAGVCLDLPTHKETYLRREEIRNSNLYTSPIEEAFGFRDNYFGLFGALGLEKDWGSFSTTLTLRAYSTNQINEGIGKTNFSGVVVPNPPLFRGNLQRFGIFLTFLK